MTIDSGATFNDQTTGSGLSILASNFGSGDNGSTAVFNNKGTFTKSGSAATSTISTTFNDSGTVNIQSGTLVLSGGGSISGTFNLAVGAFAQFNSNFSVNGGAAFLGGSVSGSGTLTIGSGSQVEFSSSVAGPTIAFSSGSGELRVDNPSTFHSPITGLALGDAIYLQGIAVASANVSGSTLTVTETNSQTLTYTVSGALTQNAFSVLFSSSSGSEIVLLPSTGNHLTGSSGPLSFTPTTAQFYQLSGETISSSTANGLDINATGDGNSADTISVEIDQFSSITVTGAFTGLNISTGGANIAITNAGIISSSAGIGIFANSGGGSTAILDYGNVSGSSIGIEAVTSGTGPLTISVEGTATITGATAAQNSRGIVALTSAGSSDITTASGVTVSAAGTGVFVANQGSSVPQADNSTISISSGGTVKSGLGTTTSEPSAILAGYFGGSSPPSSIPNPPLSGIFGSIYVSNSGAIIATTGNGIDAFNYGTGDVSVSNSGSITANAAGTAAGTSPAGYAQIGIIANANGVGNVSVVDAAGTTIASGSNGINALNQATVVPAATPINVSVNILGAINSGANLSNSGAAPAGMVIGINPGVANAFNANVYGNISVNDSGGINAAAGDGMRVFDYGIGNVAINLGNNATISALSSATASSGNAPYGIGAFNYGPGDIVVATSSGDLISSGSDGINAANQATAITAASDSLVAVNTAGNINSGTILSNNGSPPGGIVAGFLGGTAATANTAVNGNVIVNNSANITAAAGYGIEAYNYGNGNVTVNDLSGTTISGGQYGIFAYSLETGNISVVTSSGDTINSGSAGIDAVNEATAIAASANSSIVVTANGTINSGTVLTGTGHPPAGIIAGYLGGSTDPTTFPLTGLNGNVVVNNFANINPAAGDGIRAFNYGIGNVTVNDEAGSITLGGANPVNGYEDGISATNEGSGNINVTTATGILINSRNGGSGIVAVNKAPAPWPGSSFSIPSTSQISVLAYGTIESGIVLTGAGDPAAGILAGYNPNLTDTPDSNIQGNVSIDDYATITAPAGADGIRGVNYGTGTVTVTAEAGATITAGRYGIAALGFDGGDVSVTNYAAVTGGTAAIDATTTSTGTVMIDNHGSLSGEVTSYNASFTNEAGGSWSFNGLSAFTGSSNLLNIGAIHSNGTSEISGLSGVTNSGTIEVQSGSLKLDSGVSGTGTLTIDAGATLELISAVSSGQSVVFKSTTGMLKLDQAENFNGLISGFSTTDGTQANSDQIDLADINHHSLSFSEQFNSATDTLTVTDGTNTAVIHFTGTVGNLNFVDDGNLVGGVSGTSGTIVYDPPSTGQSVGPVVMHDPGQGVPAVTTQDPGPAANTTVANAPNQTSNGFGDSDKFEFNFDRFGHSAAEDFHPHSDVHQFDKSIFANAQAILNDLHDDGHGNTAIAADGHETTSLGGVLKAQHAADFHFI